MDNPKWFGFAPAHFPRPTDKCAHYHCTEEREEFRRWCKGHAEQYDAEARELDPKTKVVSFDLP